MAALVGVTSASAARLGAMASRAVAAVRGTGGVALQQRCRAAATAISQAAHGDCQRMYDELKYIFGYMGVVNKKEVGVLDLYKILEAARTPEHYKLVLQTMNLFYNFGVSIKHREIASRLVAAAMVCQMESEAVELIKLYGTWLQDPPDRKLVYAVMGHFLDTGSPLVVREIAKAVREDWRMPVEPPLYALTIEAMLQLPEDPLGEALEVHADAGRLGVRLPAAVHLQLLDRSLQAFQETSGVATDKDGVQGGAAGAEATPEAVPEAEPPPSALAHLQRALQVAEALARDGHLSGGAPTAALCSLSWLLWHLDAIPQGARASLLAEDDQARIAALFGGSWVLALETAFQDFGCHWGFSASLPQGFFRSLEASSAPEASRLVHIAKQRFGRFYPKTECH